MIARRPQCRDFGLGGQALHDFELQHEVHVRDQVRKAEQMEDQGRGDVVGQVADDAQALMPSAPQRAVVEAERIGRCAA
jgi:hypothetical protein